MTNRNLNTVITLILFTVLLPFFSLGQYQFIQKGVDMDGEASGDNFGYCVSMPDSSTVAIGAPGDAIHGGYVKVYIWDGSSWQQKGNNIIGEALADSSGWSISMPDANTIAIGAPRNDGNGTASGHVRVFVWNGSTWLQKGADINGEASGDESGYSVSMPNINTVAIGAILNDGAGSDAGHVRIFYWDGSSWQQKGNDIDGEAAGDLSGKVLSMPDSNTVAIGAPQNDGNGSRAGHTRIYSWDGSNWLQKGNDIDGEVIFNRSGEGISMPSSNTIAIGAPNNNGNGFHSGHVRIFDWDGSSWQQRGNDIDGEGTGTGDFSGWSVSMPNVNTVAIGAPLNEGNGIEAGHVRVFSWDGSKWRQQGNDIDGEAAFNLSGVSVSMPDSKTLAIGAPNNNGNGTNAGHVRIFKTVNNVSITDELTTTQIEIKIFPNPTKGLVTISSGDIKPTRIRLLELTGAEILNTSFSETIQLHKYPNGLFIVELEVDGRIYREKMLKL